MSKPETLSTTSMTLAEYAKAWSKCGEIRNRLAEVQDNLLRAETPRTNAHECAVALLDDQPLSGDHGPNREALEREFAVLEAARPLAEQRVRAAAIAYAGALYASRRDEHLALVEKVVEAFEQLADAMLAEQQFHESFNAFSTTVVPAIKVVETPWLRFMRQPRIRGLLRRANAERFNLKAKKGN
jgi:hypothetical protein